LLTACWGASAAVADRPVAASTSQASDLFIEVPSNAFGHSCLKRVAFAMRRKTALNKS